MPNANRPFKVPFSPWVPIVGMVLILGLMASLPLITLVRFVAWTGIGLMLYGFYGARRSRLREAHRSVVLDTQGPGGRGAARSKPALSKDP
jgi:APA family basic amino acid/polyamine antiporter